jgi:uncharacterized protein (TIGR02145 family)
MNRIIVFTFLFLLCKEITAQNPCPGISTVMYSGKTYNTVQIGNQCWLKENLDVGTMIQGNKDQTNNGILEKYCYENDPSNCVLYGGLYQWAEAVQYKNGATNTSWPNPSFSENVQGICPGGWHIPTDKDFQTLETSVNLDGNALKNIGQGDQNGVGTNLSGFSALLTGCRHPLGYFVNYVLFSYFWSAIDYNSNTAFLQYLAHSNNSCYLSIEPKTAGFSIRCIKDVITEVGDDNEKQTPIKCSLDQNYPNPFNQMTTITYSIPKHSFVTIKIFDSLGREIIKLVNEEKQPGYYQVNFDGNNLSSGKYYYQMRTGQFVETKKLILLK